MAFFNKIKEDFTIIPNGIFKDCTMNEVALISYIASKPSGWLFRAKTIGEVFRVERKNIQRILRSLEKKGYLKIP